MPKYIVTWTENVRYEAEIEADTFEQAVAGFSLGLESDPEETGCDIDMESIEIREA